MSNELATTPNQTNKSGQQTILNDPMLSRRHIINIGDNMHGIFLFLYSKGQTGKLLFFPLQVWFIINERRKLKWLVSG